MKEKYKKYLNEDDKFSLKTKIGIYALLVVIGGIFGFVYEYIFYFFDGGMDKFYWRGGNFLPWINIYALGAVVIYPLVYRNRKKPLTVFLKSFLVCGVLEFVSGLLIYLIGNGARFWDYNTEILNFGNVYGFICLRSVTFFGLSGLILIYGIVPFCYFIASKMNKKTFVILSVTLAAIFVLDEVYNSILSPMFGIPCATDIYKKLGMNFLKF